MEPQYQLDFRPMFAGQNGQFSSAETLWLMRQALLAARFVVYGYRTNDSFDCAGHSFGNTFRNEDVSHADRTLTSADDPHAAAADERVPWNQLIAYGMGGVIPIA